jgi:predicted transcriptional regulator
MEVLWAQGPGTVQQVLDWLPASPALAYNSVLTTIRILERKGYVEHIKDGRAYVYKPILERKDATRSEIRHLVSRFFGDSHDDLVLNILEDRGLEAGELAQLKKILQRGESK